MDLALTPRALGLLRRWRTTPYHDGREFDEALVSDVDCPLDILVDGHVRAGRFHHHDEVVPYFLVEVQRYLNLLAGLLLGGLAHIPVVAHATRGRVPSG